MNGSGALLNSYKNLKNLMRKLLCESWQKRSERQRNMFKYSDNRLECATIEPKEGKYNLWKCSYWPNLTEKILCVGSYDTLKEAHDAINVTEPPGTYQIQLGLNGSVENV